MTSEYVTLGHPDKIADYISEYMLDRYMERDRKTRYALEVQIKDSWVSLAGEITSRAGITPEERAQYVKEAVREIGYTREYAECWPEGATLNADKIEVAEHISQQSPDIAQGVDNDGWGDQGIFWGMAVNDAEHDYLPLDYWYARRIANHLYKYRFGGLDIKTQVTTNWDTPAECVVAIPVQPKYMQPALGAVEGYVKSVLGSGCRVIVNGTGNYVVHASMGDCGTTGRKLAVDFYGGNCRLGGGSPWTKDPTKADLTLNLYARKLAVDYVKAHGMPSCYVSISCCIGQRRINVTVYDGNNAPVERWTEDKKPDDIISMLGLRGISYAKLCREGIASI